MTVEELADMFAGLVENGHGDRQVLIATQPAWPLQTVVDGFWDPVNDDEDHDPTAYADTEEEYSDDLVPVYLRSGQHPYGMSPYAPGAVFS